MLFGILTRAGRLLASTPYFKINRVTEPAP